MPSSVPSPPAAGSISIATPGGPLHLDALADDVVRVRLAPPGGRDRQRPSYALDPGARWSGPSDWRVRDGDEAVEVETAALRVRVATATGATVVTDRERGRALVDAGPLASDGVSHSVSLGRSDRLFGLGDKAFGLDRRGETVEMWNTDAFKYRRGTDPLYKSVPFVLKEGEAGAVGLFYDNSFCSRFDLGASDPDRMHYEADGGTLDLYVLHGPSPLAVVEAFARLTGRTPMLPKWALGYHQSRYSYRDEAEIREVARGFRERGIPCDTLYFDIHYMDGYRVFTWDEGAFPDPPGLLADLAADGFKSVVIIDPGVKADDPDYAVYREGHEIGAYVTLPDGSEFRGDVWPGECAFPDFTAERVRQWWGGLHAGLVRAGVDGVWNDMNEPAVFQAAHVEGSMDAEVEVGTIPDGARHAFDGEGGTHAEAHNVYGMQMLRATFEGLRSLRPDRRPFTITRAAYAGTQRYGTSWTGDNTASWAHLRLAVETCLSLGVSGMTFTGSDVGGFVGAPSGELLARWTQVGALTPLFRNHSAVDAPRQEPWLFGEEVERVCREAIELRYRLLPVLYTALWQAATHGTPILRPLPLVHPHDDAVRQSEALGVYVGDGLLAYPVLERGQTHAEVYLPDVPEGWYDFHSGDALPSGRATRVETPLDRIPIFVRGGTVLPLAPVRQHTGEPVGRLAVRVYPARGRHTSWLYEDPGDGYGESWIGRLDLEDDGESIHVSCAVTGEHAPEWTGWDVTVFGLDGPPSRVAVDGDAVDRAWDGALRFPAPVAGSLEILR